MVVAIVFAFLVGVSVGVLIGRRAASSDRAVPAVPAVPATPAPATITPVRTSGPAPPPIAAPNKRARKVGLTEDAFRPADDILEKLRLVAEGQLEPTALADEPGAAAAPEPKEPPTPPDAPPLANPDLTEAERRVLERLRREAQDLRSDSEAGTDRPSDREGAGRRGGFGGAAPGSTQSDDDTNDLA